MRKFKRNSVEIAKYPERTGTILKWSLIKKNIEQILRKASRNLNKWQHLKGNKNVRMYLPAINEIQGNIYAPHLDNV